MSTFERIYQTNPARESDEVREALSIALSDQEYLERIRRDGHAMGCTFVMRPVEPENPNMSDALKKKYEIAKALTTDEFNLSGPHLKDAVKKPKRTKKGIVS